MNGYPEGDIKYMVGADNVTTDSHASNNGIPGHGDQSALGPDFPKFKRLVGNNSSVLGNSKETGQHRDIDEQSQQWSVGLAIRHDLPRKQCGCHSVRTRDAESRGPQWGRRHRLELLAVEGAREYKKLEEDEIRRRAGPGRYLRRGPGGDYLWTNNPLD